MTIDNTTTGDRDSYDRSLWHATAPPPSPGHLFEPGGSYDCIVIGAGIAGLVSTLALQHSGANVALIEASVPGAGATGRSGGFVVPTFSAVRPGNVIESYRERGERLVQAVAGSADRLFRLVQQYRIECDAGQAGWFQPAHSSEALDRIESDVELWRSLGATIEVLDMHQTQTRTGLQGYAGSLFIPSGGAIHPVKFLHGLIEAAAGLGCRLFFGTPARCAERSGQCWHVGTERGVIRSDKLLICTNARSPELFPDLEESVVPLRVCQVATQPLAPAQRAHLVGQGQSVSDTQMDLFSYRFDAQWRLISGAMPVLPVRTGQRLARRVVARMARELALGFEPQLEYAWFGEASVTANRIPALYELGPGAYALTACNGRGLALSTLLGGALGQALASGNFDELPLPMTRPARASRRSLQMIGSRFYPVYGRVRDALRI